MASVGRPRVLDEFKRREICALVSIGCGLQSAADYVGCNPTTIRREALRNAAFHEQLRRAELTAELEPLRSMQRAAATHWRAAAWILERTRPASFGRRNPETISPQQVEALLVSVVEEILDELPDAELVERVQRRLTATINSALRELWAAERPRRDPARRRPNGGGR